MTLIHFIILTLLTFISNPKAQAYTLEWHGSLGAESVNHRYYRHTRHNDFTAASDNQVIAPPGGVNDNEINFESYVLKLSPWLVINDATTLKGEVTTGYGSGGFFGDSSTQARSGGVANTLYFYNTSTGGGNLNLRKMYAELYSDTGTYRIGRQSSSWGLGAVFHAGEGVFDRHSTIRDGISIDYKFGNFQFSPYWYRVASSQGLLTSQSAKEMGISFLYDNPDKEMQFGILFGSKKNGMNSTQVTSNISGTSTPLQRSSVKVTDIYLKKSFSDFTFAVEVPIISGDLGDLYTANSRAKYRANAFIGQINYSSTPKWEFGFHGGFIDGEDGNQNEFGAMYLHPNFHIAQIMFRYNPHALNDSTQSYFDASMTNALYGKLFTTYNTEAWSWTVAYITAKARETAKTGRTAFNHEKNRTFTANTDQADDYGSEVDVLFKYEWNQNTKVTGTFAYQFVGDYYSHTNATLTQKSENGYLYGVGLELKF